MKQTLQKKKTQTEALASRSLIPVSVTGNNYY